MELDSFKIDDITKEGIETIEELIGTVCVWMNTDKVRTESETAK
jgi:hypothetical protein